MSNIRKEKKYFQLRKQLKTCENFQQNYFVISMPKKRKMSSTENEEAEGAHTEHEEQHAEHQQQQGGLPLYQQPPMMMHHRQSNSQPFIHQQHQVSMMTNNQITTAPSKYPSSQTTVTAQDNSKSNNTNIINTKNILRFDSPPLEQPSTSIVPTKPPPVVQQLPNGLIQYNNVQISTCNEEETQKTKKRKTTNKKDLSQPSMPPSVSNNNMSVQQLARASNTQYGFLSPPASCATQYLSSTHQQKNSQMAQTSQSEPVITNVQYVDFGQHNFVLSESFSESNAKVLDVEDSISFSFSEPFVGEDEAQFDLPDIELFGSLDFLPSTPVSTGYNDVKL